MGAWHRSFRVELYPPSVTRAQPYSNKAADYTEVKMGKELDIIRRFKDCKSLTSKSAALMWITNEKM